MDGRQRSWAASTGRRGTETGHLLERKEQGESHNDYCDGSGPHRNGDERLIGLTQASE
jgi:hypothetical protein